MKKIIIFLGILGALLLGFTTLKGIWLILFLLIIFPLVFFYLPILLRIEKREELTEEAKKERDKNDRFSRWE
ncbi:MAG TPA: hypothetical protein VJZ51_05790 [Bacilli bacterium]|nr:hypothetical protein [Bacilli bacterium]